MPLLRNLLRARRTPPRSLYRPQVETLEVRCLLDTKLVTLLTDTSANASPGELRTVMATAASGDTITFQAGLSGSIDLNASLGSLHSGKDLTIQGPGLRVLSINGQNAITDFVVDTNTTVTITGLTIRGGLGNFSFRNQNVDQIGGGIVDKGTLFMSNCAVSNNTGARGGGIAFTPGAHLTMQDSTLSGNSAGLLGGGAIGGAGSSVNLQNCTLSGNQAFAYGGAVYQISGSTTLTNCTLSGNSADSGGAIYSNGYLAVRNCTISGNSSIDRGSGIRNAYGRMVLTNSIIAGNGRFGSDVAGDADLSASFNNVIGDNAFNNFVDGSNGNLIRSDPRLGPLQDNGGPTFTMALLADSPAIDAGDSALALAAGLTTDQRGLPRFSGPSVDIGAFEFASFVTAVSLNFTPNATSADLVTITATVQVLGSPMLVPGTVALAVNGLPLPVVSLNGGTATFSLPITLAAGSYTVTAVYNPVRTFGLSQTSQLLVVIAPGGTGPLTPSDIASPLAPPSATRNTDNRGPGGTPIVVTGADAGSLPQVNVYDASTGTLKTSFFAFATTFTGGVRVALGDVNGDGVPDIIVGADPGGGPEVRVFDGVTLQMIRDFQALPVGFRGGVFVAAGDVNGDGFADIITAADKGGGPQVTVTSGKDGTALASFFATAATFTGGIRVASADLNGDGFADVIAVAGPGGGPQVTVFDGRSLNLLTAFYALTPTFTGGLYVAAGDVTGDGKADIIAGAEKGGGPQVAVFDGTTQTQLASFFALPATFTGGVRVGFSSNFRGRAAILSTAGPGGGPQVTINDGLSQAVLGSFFAFAPQFTGGVFVAG